MDIAAVQDILSELVSEIEDLRANQKLLSETSGTKLSMADAVDIKALLLQDVQRETEHLHKLINELKM